MAKSMAEHLSDPNTVEFKKELNALIAKYKPLKLHQFEYSFTLNNEWVTAKWLNPDTYDNNHGRNKPN